MPKPAECGWCGDPLPMHEHAGRPRRWCSKACASKGARAEGRGPKPDIPCAVCGKPMWRGATLLPAGQATCLPCRRARREAETKPLDPLRFCEACGQPYEPVRVNQRYCRPEHRPNRGSAPKTRTTAERGYGAKHRAEKERHRPTVDAGQAWCTEPVCLMPSRWIEPGTPWHLAHDRANGGYHGPAHARCNTAEGGRWRHAQGGGVAAKNT